VRRLLIGGSPDQERCPASEVNDGGCPEKPVHLRAVGLPLIERRLEQSLEHSNQMRT
jgi:hypothetical protein